MQLLRRETYTNEQRPEPRRAWWPVVVRAEPAVALALLEQRWRRPYRPGQVKRQPA